MKYLLFLSIFLTSNAIGQVDDRFDAKFNEDTTKHRWVNEGFLPRIKYWVSFEKRYPHISEDDFLDCWIIGNNQNGIMWQYHFASDTLFIDTSKIKHIIYLK